MKVWLLAGLVAIAVAVFATGNALPDEVGSHFNGQGQVDGSMARGAYLLLMAALAGGVPLLTWWLQCRAARAGRINLPHRDHWMAPARRAGSVSILECYAASMAVALAVFLLGVHLLVVKAHRVNVDQPSLDMGLSTAWVLLFVAFSVSWVVWMWRRFSNIQHRLDEAT